MDKRLVEIRWHGRGGQGAKTASVVKVSGVLEEEK